MKLRSNPEYWGRTAAGILFTCEQDNTISAELRPELCRYRILWRGAKTEVVQACNELPPDMSASDIVTTVDYRDGSFLYRNFVVNLTPEQKRGWDIDIEEAEDAWENDDWGWFNVDNLPSPLHFGVENLLRELGLL